MGRVERGEQNISIQNLIQIALTLKVELNILIPSIRQLKSPSSKTV
jgi:transcriptional regulator with XRE-family HTH domain